MDMKDAGLALIVVSVVILTGSQLLIKSRLSVHGVVPLDVNFGRYLMLILADWKLWVAGSGLVLASICWYAGISRVPLSLAYPFGALSYPLILLSSVVLLGESFSWPAFVGNLLIVAGVLLVALKPF